MKKETIIAKNQKHLKKLIKKEINLHGNECDLNFIDTSIITDMSYIFESSQFNGNISGWNTSKVTNMSSMFANSKFNGDISGWNTYCVVDMYCMFTSSNFNGDISAWDVSNVTDMAYMFYASQFNGDTSNWNTINVQSLRNIFYYCNAPLPYWAKIANMQDRVVAIDVYQNKKKLEQLITQSDKSICIIKI